MKQAYSEFQYTKLARDLAKMKFENIYLAKMWLKDFLKKYCQDNPGDKGDYRGTYDSTITQLWVLSSSLSAHLFCHKYLFDWLISHAKDIPIEKAWARTLFNFNEKDKSCIPIVLHVSGGQSLSCIYSIGESSTPVVLVGDSEKNFEQYFIPDSIPDINNPHWQTELGKNVYQSMMFLKGLSIYSACCENIIIEGVPEDLKHAPRFNEKCSKYLRTHEDITGDDSRSISPHFRNGHFRLLVSDRFTKKKGQVIFVRECFVKGQAKTVTEIEEEKI